MLTMEPGNYLSYHLESTWWVTDREELAEVVEESATRSHTVQTPGGEFRRYQQHLNRSSPSSETNAEPDVILSENENSQSQVEPTNESPITSLRLDQDTITPWP